MSRWSRRCSTSQRAQASGGRVRGGNLGSPRESCRVRPVSRVLCPPSAGGDGHLSRTPVARRLQRPRPEGLAGYLRAPSYLVLLRTGFAWPTGHPAAGGLLPHHFTLTDLTGPAVSFLWHFPSGHPDWALPSVLPFGARTFLPTPPRRDGATTRPPRPGDSTPDRATLKSPLPSRGTAGPEASPARRWPGWPGRPRHGSSLGGRASPCIPGTIPARS